MVCSESKKRVIESVKYKICLGAVFLSGMVGAILIYYSYFFFLSLIGCSF